MTVVPHVRFRLSSGAFLGVALALGGLLTTLLAEPAAAQGFGWFGGLFGGGQPQGPSYNDPRNPGYGYGDRSRSPYGPRRRAQRNRKPVEQAQEPAAKPSAPAKPATVFVYVFGDSLGQLLANGLDDALADRPEVGIVHLARGPSGLVNDAYYDWPKTVSDLLARPAKPPSKPDQDKGSSEPDKAAKDKAAKDKAAKDKAAKDKVAKDNATKDNAAKDKAAKDKAAKEKADPAKKIDVAVMMIGSNDRQPIIQDGKKIAPGTDEWNALYRKRVMAIAEAFQKKQIPLIWVGVPIVKDDDFADDMAALNDIYRDAAARTGATYVDTWEPFSDANGDFSAFGPDINGQTVRLRTADGIFFTKAGSRKLAHFIEAHVRRDLDGKTPLPELPTAESPAANTDRTTGKDKPAVALVKPEAGPIKNLGEPPAAKDGSLTEVTQFKAEAARDPVLANSLVKGRPDPAPIGRADNFRWPATGAP